MAASLPDEGALRSAVAALLAGGLVAFPTETVYGLGADADRPDAVSAIFRVKGRPADHPLILHVCDAKALGAWTRDVPACAYALVDRFWPGPLTLVLPRSARASHAVTGGQETVGVRCPSHPWAQALLRDLAGARGDASVALAAPSANRYGRISPTSAEHVRADFGPGPESGIACILDGGPSTLGIESTIVDFPPGRVRILRPGSILAAQLQDAAGVPAVDALAGAQTPRTSGRVEGHYAPRKPLELVEPSSLSRRLEQLRGLRIGILAPAAHATGRPGSGAALLLRIDAPDAADEYARLLYRNLRELDASAAQRLLVAMPPAGPAWDAIHDRLRRAAAGSAGAMDDAD